MQATETEGLEGKLDDENSGRAEFSGVEKESRLLLREKLVFLDFHLLDLCRMAAKASAPLDSFAKPYSMKP